MTRPATAREGILDAFERLLIDEGERAATLDATARGAGVSKGGLLYHFGSKEALVDGLVDRLSRLVDQDVEAIETAPDGPISHFVRTSVESDTALDRAYVAASRLAQGGFAPAQAAIRDIRERWGTLLATHVPDPTAALVISLVSDGLYAQSALREQGAPAEDIPDDEAMDALVALLERLAERPATR